MKIDAFPIPSPSTQHGLKLQQNWGINTLLQSMLGKVIFAIIHTTVNISQNNVD
jgi:hypothetical protein